MGLCLLVQWIPGPSSWIDPIQRPHGDGSTKFLLTYSGTHVVCVTRVLVGSWSMKKPKDIQSESACIYEAQTGHERT